ncbi:MAG TPA: lamin tail domain-containing protein, partial [Planctomycetota bacterium]|nr:lamin tail domain-containing protein [Planctomycetota bacterium]
RPNFSSMDPQFEETVLVDQGAEWRYAKGTVPFSTPPAAWREPAFDDSAWALGPSGFGYGDDDDATLLTDMLNGYTSVAVRKRFVLTAEEIAEPGELYLGVDYDDGFYAYLNGEEAARFNCGTSGVEFPFDAIATGAREAGTEDLFALPKSLLRAGENVLAIAGHNFSIGSSDFSLIPRVIRRRLIVGTDPSGSSLAFNELYRGAAPGGGWVEIHNRDAVSANISGYRLTDSPSRENPFVFPQGSMVPGRGFLVVDEAATSLLLSDLEVHLFLLAPDGKAVTASVFERDAPPGAARGGYSEARWPDGGPLEWVTPSPTRGTPNSVPRTTDVVINEIYYNPPEERTGEFIELYNRGAAAVDISGFRFTSGIDFTIEDGTVIPPGGYLVVAESPSLLLEHYGFAGAQGPWIGKLANDGENIRLDDRSGNLVNEVRYSEGGSWSRWADGGGGSLELIDPHQDNSFASAWDSSDESEKTAWEELSFRVPNYVVAGQSELHVYLVEAGVVRVDDVSISRAGGANLIPNPGFETSTAPWVIEGTHVRSRRITSDSHGGSACLEVNASGQGDTLVNRIEIETSPRMTAGAYDVSLWARWVRGASFMVVHGEFTAGPFGGRPSPATNLSGNSLSKGLRLTVPRNIGTPGAQNSVRANLIASTGSGNLGPVIDSVKHTPPSPGPGQPVRVSARVSDSNGLAAVEVHYRAGSGAGGFTAIPLQDDGANGDDEAQDGIFTGEIPGHAATTRVVFFVEAADTPGAERRFPLDAPAITCLYQVQGPVSPGLDTARMILDTARTSELQTRTLHSNDLLPGTFIFNNEEVYYNVGVRYRGSPWGRPGRSNYRVRFEDDHRFPRGRKAINLDNSGGGPNEGAAYFLGLRNAGPDSAAPMPDYAYARTQLNGGSIGTHALAQPIDRDFLKTWYGDPSTSVLLKVEGRRMFTDGGTLAAWDGGSFIHRGPDKEHYRDYFIHGQRDSMDEWDSLIALTQVMDRSKTPNAVFDQKIDEVLDVEAFLRCLAPRVLQADWDAFCIGNGHNGYLVIDPRDNRWELLPHDMDNTFGDPNATLFPAADPDVARFLSRPGPRRIYFRIIWDYIHGGYWSAATAGPYFRALQTATGISTSGVLGYLTTSGNHKRTLIQGSTTIAFKIVTNSGNDVMTEETAIDIVGDAPIQLSSIFYQRGGDEPKLLEPTWTTPTRWQARFELPETQNDFEFLGFDSGGALSATAQF